MSSVDTVLERLIGREAEMRTLHSALQKRQSRLIWGARDSGKTFLVAKMLEECTESERRKCICCTGTASRRQLIEQCVGQLYLAGDRFVRRKVRADHYGDATLNRWIGEQSALRLRGIFFTAAEQGDYRFFLDHLSTASHSVAQFIKEIMNRTGTPVYLTGHGYSQGEIGYAWSLYWTDEYRIRLGPLPEASARELLEICVQKFALHSVDLRNFREELLHLSGHLPGSIVKMCELATDPRYRYGDQVKMKVLHVDYLLRGNRFPSSASYPP
ncbi:MAG TPA: ATP-binding protein [Candidatus Acidoferrum sp.]|nr:ATP-binding protein [Candidatus Acidoferrum sp.]